MTAFALGLDGFVVCLFLGPLAVSRSMAFGVAIMMGLCDALAWLSGSAMAPNLVDSPSWLRDCAPLPVAAYGAYLLSRTVQLRTGEPIICFLVSLIVSLDNFAAAAMRGADASSQLEFGGFVALCSGIMALAGLGAGRALSRYAPVSPRRFAASGLILFGITSAIA